MDGDGPAAGRRPVLEGRRHMSKIWYCPNCGYEVGARGRCHLCRQRLVASRLPELEVGDEDDEVGYRLEDWSDRERGRLIESLNRDEIPHRFEDDELVVTAEDETRVDDLMAELAANPELDDITLISDGDGGRDQAPTAVGAGGEVDAEVGSALRLLDDAARRLRQDPTDMQADADVAEASATVFMVDGYSGADDATWAAVGRVTRRLLSALGADEALEEEIRAQAAVLDKLVEPLLPTGRGAPALTEPETADSGPERDEPHGDEPDVDERDGDEPDIDETVYELPEWLPEQRARLGVLLDDAGIRYMWDFDDLVVPSDRETEVEALFDQVGSPAPEEDDDDDDDGESRYRSLEELFAAADRLAGDPGDEQRASDAVARVREAAGPPPLGLDEVQWFRIMTQARTLSESIEAGCEEHVIAEEATALRDLLRAVV
jgi:hypothetical protein